jgi:hypothetical protein
LQVLFCSSFYAAATCSLRKLKKEQWVLGGFERPKGINPIIEPDTSSVFYDPMLKKEIRWEDNDTFNPAAVVRGDSVYVIYRAEDRTGRLLATGPPDWD